MMWLFFFAKFPILCYLLIFSLLDSSLSAALSFPFDICYHDIGWGNWEDASWKMTPRESLMYFHSHDFPAFAGSRRPSSLLKQRINEVLVNPLPSIGQPEPGRWLSFARLRNPPPGFLWRGGESLTTISLFKEIIWNSKKKSYGKKEGDLKENKHSIWKNLNKKMASWCFERIRVLSAEIMNYFMWLS